MGKAGEKQKRRPKLTDKKQSERFKEAARQIGADESTDALERIVTQMALQKSGGTMVEFYVQEGADEATCLGSFGSKQPTTITGLTLEGDLAAFTGVVTKV